LVKKNKFKLLNVECTFLFPLAPKSVEIQKEIQELLVKNKVAHFMSRGVFNL